MGVDPRRPQPEPGARSLSRLRRAPLYVRTRALRAANLAADRLETRRPADEPLRQPALFVIGAPRSGSTLLYQVLVQAFDVGYLSNRHCRLWGAPSLVERRRHPTPPASFSSRFGRTTGPDEPSECEQFWYRFFRRSPQYVTLEDMSPTQLGRLRSAVGALGDAAGRPLVFKNLYCTLRLAPLAKALPEAVFVDLRRDLEDNAASLLAARRLIHGDYETWWSAEPPEIGRLRGLPAHEQVVEQVRSIEALVDRDAEKLGRERFLVIRYEDLCDDPEAQLAAVARFAEANDIRLARRQPVPAKFDRPPPSSLDPDLHERLVAYITKR